MLPVVVVVVAVAEEDLAVAEEEVMEDTLHPANVVLALMSFHYAE
jgi:hypothetical protein